MPLQLIPQQLLPLLPPLPQPLLPLRLRHLPHPQPLWPVRL